MTRLAIKGGALRSYKGWSVPMGQNCNSMTSILMSHLLSVLISSAQYKLQAFTPESEQSCNKQFALAVDDGLERQKLCSTNSI